MARSKANGGVNKSEEIRKMLAESPQMKSGEIIAQLSVKGIKVAPSLVYMVKSQLKRKQRRQKREQVATASRAMGIVNPVDLILKVKSLAGEAGGIKRLKQLVDAFAE